MKIKPAPKRESRPSPISFRFSKATVKQLNALAKATKKTKTAILEEIIGQAHKDTLKK